MWRSIILILCVMVGTSVAAEVSRRVDVVMPRVAATNEMVALAVQAGKLSRGTQIDVTMPDGQLIGTVSPFGTTAGGTYNFPLRPIDIHNGHVSALLTVRRYGMPPRAPTEAEVPHVGVVFLRMAP